MKVEQCRYCKADVVFLRSASTGRVGPIDALPVPGGNVAVDPIHGVYIVMVGAERDRFDATTHDPDARPSLHTSHFATCPNVTAVRLARSRAKQRRQTVAVRR